jgi:hypothetical protein
MTTTHAPVEFQPWQRIPFELRRTDDEGEREVLGTTFTGEPVWLPWMGTEER